MNVIKNEKSKLLLFNTTLLILALLYLFNFFTPSFQSTLIMDKAISKGGSGGLNGRSLFWLSISFIAFSLAFYCSFFKNFIWIKTYFILITLLIFMSIFWSQMLGTSITRAILWLLAGGAVTVLYIQEYQYGDLKRVFVYISAALLCFNIFSILLYPSSTFAIDGALSGIFSSKNVLGGIAGLFAVILSGMLIQYRFYNKQYKLFVLIMLFAWLILLVLSMSKSSLFFSFLIIFGLYFYHYKNQYVMYLTFLLVFIFICFFPIVFYLVGDNLFTYYAEILPPELFTGRGIIWSYIFSEFNDYFWLGVGYGSYWTPVVRDVFDIEHSFFTVLNSSHNGYIHIFTNMGVLGLTAFLFFTSFKLIKFGSRLELWELGLLIFISLHAFFESDFLLYKNFWFLFCAVLSRIEYPSLKLP